MEIRLDIEVKIYVLALAAGRVVTIQMSFYRPNWL